MTPENAVDVLNRALDADPVAMNALFKFRAECNDVLADDETIQVRSSTRGKPSVSILGLLNGILGIRDDGYGHITAVVNETTGDLVAFKLTSKLRDR